MMDFARMTKRHRRGAKAAVGLLMLGVLAACAVTPKPEPAPAAAAPAPTPPQLTPPPIDLAGRWRLTAAAGGACAMTLGAGVSQGTIAPEGGCPGNFFTSRKWTYENDYLIIRNHKGEPLAQLSFTGGHFEGKDGGGTLSLSK